MKNPFRDPEEIQRDLGGLAVRYTRVQLVSIGGSGSWQPAVNAFRCGARFVLCVELAGVERSSIDIRAEPRRVIVRGTRPVPEPSCDEAPSIHVLALEIDHGRFERVIELPAEIDSAQVTAEHRNGLLWIQLPLRSMAGGE